MGLWHLLLSCTLLALCSADQVIGTVNSMIDPNRITWWRTKWSPAPIVLTNNNVSLGTSITFYICPATSITSGVFEVTFPTSFTPVASGSSTITGQVLQITGQTFVAGVDSTVVISGQTTPSTTGPYGPFAIRTRYSANSQQADVNLTFGSVFITPTAKTITSLVVAVVGATSTGTVINTTGNTLSFTFTLATSLWRYDTFTIAADNRWTITSGASCASVKTSGYWNNLNGTNSANPYALDCVITQISTTNTAQSVYIYGLAVDGLDLVTTGNQYVILTVSSVTAPNAVYTSTAYSWTVSTNRFGTTTILETGSTTTGPTVTTGTITTVTWLPTWGTTTSYIATGTSYFMDLTVTTVNPIPALTSGTNAGNIVITLTDSVSSELISGITGATCYIVTPYTGVYTPTCTTSTTTITISGLPLVAAGSVKVRNIVAFTTATPGVSSVRTYAGASATLAVDATVASLASFTAVTSTVNTAALTSATFGLGFQTIAAAAAATANAAGGTGNNNQILQFFISLTGHTPNISSTYSIYCPITSGIDDFNIGIPTGSVYAYTNDAAGTAILTLTGCATTPACTGATAVGTTNVPTYSPGTSGAMSGTPGSITWAGNIGGTSTTTAGSHLVIYSASSTSYITLPKVVPNLATAYECRASISTTVSSTTTTASGAFRFTVTPQLWTTKTFTLPCTTYIDGVPAIITLAPAVVSIPSSSTTATYYVEFAFTSATNFWGSANSGLTAPATTNSGGFSEAQLVNTTPYTAGASAGTSAVTFSTPVVYGSAGAFTVAVPGISITVGASSSTIVTFPVGGYPTPGASVPGAPTITSYYIIASDPRYKFITQQATAAISITSAAYSSATATSALLTGSGTYINGSTGQSLGLILSGVSTLGVATAYYSWFSLPTGYIWATNGLTATNAYTNTYFFSINTAFRYAGVLAYYSSAGTPVNGFLTGAAGTTATVTLSGFSVPLGVVTGQSTSVLIGTGAATAAACFLVSSTTLGYTINSGAITSVSVSPTSVAGSAVSISQTVTFTLPHGIPLGGSIYLTYSSSWTTTYVNTVCVATGLTNASATTSVTCGVSGTLATVTGFAAVSNSSSNTISIAISGLIAPTYSSGATSINFATNISSYTGATSSTNLIDTVATPTNAVTITTAATVGTTTWTTKTVYPSTAGASAASDLYLKFSLPHSLPASGYGYIVITSPLTFKLSSGAINNYCFFTLPYLSCSVTTSTTLTIYIAQAYTGGAVLELYLDSAVTNPSTTTVTSSAFSIVSTWGNVIVDNDGTTSTATFTASAILSSILSTANAGLSFAPTTAGEVATYTFDFKDTVAYALGDQYWILFPSQFDYFLGDIWTWFTNEANTYYIDCNSAQLGVTWCQVDHGIVVVTGSSVVTASSEIVININNVINPPYSSTASNPFMIYHINSSGTYLTINQSFGTVSPTAQASNNLYVRSLVQTSNILFASSDYTWRLYITDTMYSDSQLQVLFPREYDLNKFDQKTTYSCNSNYILNSATTASTTLNWNSASSCSVNGNLITLPASTTSSSTAFTTASVGGNVVNWTVQGVTNTQWAQSRTAASTTTDFDVTDSALWPIYTYWATKFTFFIYRSSSTNLVYTSRSYPNTNAAYTGFFDGFKPLYVNANGSTSGIVYSPINKSGRIVVRAGTQTTDLYIQTAGSLLPLSAKQIVLTPTTNSKTPDSGKLKYTSVADNWTLFQAYWQIRFRVAAAIDLIKGLYYINWSNNETKQTGLSNVQYDPPVGTLVEVIAQTPNSYTFTVGTIPNILTGYTSVPLKISISNAPHADVTVGITISGSIANISVSPASLTFGPDINALYFQLTVASGYDMTLGSVQTLAFSLSGTNAAVYAIAPTQKFTITQSSTTVVAGNVVSWGLGTATKTTETSSPTSDQVGVIYYQLSASGAVIPSFSTLKATVGSLVNSNSTSTTTTSSTNSGANSQSDPATGETWAQFQWRIYKTHLQQVWVGSVSQPTTTASTTLLFNWLYAATTYQLAGYLDNLSTSTSPTVHTETFTTTAIAVPQPFTLAFTGSVPTTFSPKIAQEVAALQGVNPLRLGNATITSTARRLATTATTTFVYTLVPNRFSESPDPTAQAVLSTAQQTALAASLVTDGITAATLNTVTLNAVPSRTVPTWTTAPTSGGATSSSVTVTLRSSTAGQTCCVALTSSATAPTADQVILGLTPTSTAAPNSCIVTNTTLTTNSVQVSSLTAATSYYVYCTATDTYPLWPTQMTYSTSNPLTSVAITTLSTGTTVVTSASYFGGLLLLLALLLH